MSKLKKEYIMKRKVTSRVVLPLAILFFFGSWNPDSTSKKSHNFDECTMDIFAQNNTSVALDYVKFISAIETETMSNIAGGGGTDSGIFTWDVSQGFVLIVKLGNSPGSGRIRVYKGSHTRCFIV